MSEVVPALRAAPRLSLGGLMLLVSLSLIWGVNWPLMKIVFAEVPILTFRTLCLAIAGPLLLGIAALAGERVHVSRRERLPLAVAAFFNVTCWQVLTALGVFLMEPGRASIVAYTMPVWAALFAAIILKERVGAAKLAGLALGLAALALLIVPDLAQLRGSPFGALSMLGGAVSWAMGTVATKRYRWTVSTAQMTGWQLIIGGAPILLATLFLDTPAGLLAIRPAMALLILWMILGPIVFAQWAFFRLLELLPASIAAIATLAVPVIGVLSSAVILGEHVGIAEIAALGFVVAALVLVLVLPAKARA